MSELVSITTYPLTGARGNELGMARVGPGGIEDDRVWVCYDAEPSDTGIHERVGLSKCSALTTIGAEIRDDGSLTLVADDETVRVEVVDPVCNMDPTLVQVNEYGNITPCYYAGDGASLAVSGLLGMPNIRLGRKTPEWLDGGITPPAERKVAPVHIVNRASVLHLAGTEIGQSVNMVADERRFRPTLCVDGFEPLAEQGWPGRIVAVGDVSFRIVRSTPRCKVTGMDPQTGRQMKDVPRVLRDLMDPSEGSKIGDFGVYGYPLVNSYGERPLIRVGDTVSVKEAEEVG